MLDPRLTLETDLSLVFLAPSFELVTEEHPKLLQPVPVPEEVLTPTTEVPSSVPQEIPAPTPEAPPAPVEVMFFIHQ